MVTLAALYIGLSLVALFGVAGYTYLDAPEYDMNPRKWAAIAFFVPVFGFFAYLFERDERRERENDREEMFVDGPFKIHKSRADDVPWVSDDEREETDERE